MRILRKLELTDDQIDYLIKNTDLSNVDNKGNNALMYMIATNQRLKKYQLDYLIENSNLNIVNKESFSPLMYILKQKKFKIDKNQLELFFDNRNDKLKNKIK